MSQLNLALCANLSDLVKKVILAFCEVNVSFTHRLDIYGSVHVRSDDKDVTSFVLNEHCRKEVEQDDDSDGGEQTLIRQTSRSDGSHRKQKAKNRERTKPSSENERNRFDELMSNEQLKLVNEIRGENGDSSAGVDQEDARDLFDEVGGRLCDEPETNGIMSEEEKKSQRDKSKRHSERTTSDGDNKSLAGEAEVTEGPTEYDETRRRQYNTNSWVPGVSSGREVSDDALHELKTKRAAKKIKLEAALCNADTSQVKNEPLSCVRDAIDLEYDDDENVGNDESDYNNLGYHPAGGDEEEADRTGEDEGQMEYQNPPRGYSQSDMYTQQRSSRIHSNSVRQGAPPHDGEGPSTKRSSSNANVCGYCMRICYSSLQLRLHIERHHNGGLSNIDDPEFSASPSQVSSAGGYFPLTSSSSAASSQGGEADRLACSACSLSFRSLDGLRCHENSKHSMNKVYRCQFCSQAFLTRQAAYTHRTRFHRPKLVHTMH